MKIAVINYSAPCYNLAVDKIANQMRAEGHEVNISPGRADMWALECEKAYLSVIFTWDLLGMILDAKLLLQKGIEIEIGGPAASAMAEVVEKELGVKPFIGIDPRFEFTPGKNYKAVFTSRGCPRGCPFCIVPILEGKKIIEYDDFSIPVGKNPYICDNNIILTSWEHQKMVVEKVKDIRNLDFNSGFDDRIFMNDPEKYYNLYSQTHLEAWRFAYDKPEQRDPIKACADFLHEKGVNYRNIIVFCLIGYPGQSFDECQEKLQYLVDIGTSPYPQRYRPLDILSRNEYDPGWAEGSPDMLFGYYGVPFIWRSCTWKEYLENYEATKKRR